MLALTVGVMLLLLLLPIVTLRAEQLAPINRRYALTCWVMPLLLGSFWLARFRLAALLGHLVVAPVMLIGMLSLAAAGIGVRLVLNARKSGDAAEVRRLFGALLIHSTPGLLLLASAVSGLWRSR